MKLTYITGSQPKFDSAQAELASSGLELTQAKLDLVEIQAESSLEVSAHKAEQAFAELKTPVVVSDNSWHISALNGFPGPYMHSINQWLKAADWIKLMSGQSDRTVELKEFVTYCDENGLKQFERTTVGQILSEPAGTIGTEFDQIVSITPDGKSIAEWHESSTFAPRSGPSLWTDLATWLSEQK